jgi:hypothetical protein
MYQPAFPALLLSVCRVLSNLAQLSTMLQADSLEELLCTVDDQAFIDEGKLTKYVGLLQSLAAVMEVGAKEDSNKEDSLKEDGTKEGGSKDGTAEDSLKEDSPKEDYSTDILKVS